MSDSSASEDPTKTMPSTAGERPRRGRPLTEACEHRKRIIRSLTDGGATKSEIAKHLGVSRQLVEYHIKQMNQAPKRARKPLNPSRLNDRLSLMRCRRFIALMCLSGLIDEDGASEATGLPPKMFRSMMTHVRDRAPDRSPATTSEGNTGVERR